MQNIPFFSVIIPCYNVAAYIQQTLQSIYQQTFQDFEIIIINDGSKDNLLEILEQETDPRIRVISQPNRGVSAARNRALQEARGKYVAFQDGDDLWCPFHLELAKLFFDRYPNYQWFSTIPQKMPLKSDFVIPEAKPEGIQFYESNWFLELAPVPICNAVVMNRESALSFLHFPENMKMFEDNVAWGRFAMQYPEIGTANCRSVFYRIRRNSATKKSTAVANITEGDYAASILAQKEMLRDPRCPKEARLYFQTRSLYMWKVQIESISIRRWKRSIRRFSSVTGFLNAFILYMYAAIVGTLTKKMAKSMSRKFRKAKKALNQELIRRKKKLI